jgi:hypothetical protein
MYLLRRMYMRSSFRGRCADRGSKIENFIRTKYESKRWVMEGGIPDPSTLEDSDDDNVVRHQNWNYN